jgi:hypothetical protein
MTWWAHGGIPKKILTTYDKWNLKPQISSIFHFDRVSDGQMARILGIMYWRSSTLFPKNEKKIFFEKKQKNSDLFTLPIAKIVSVKNARAWVSMVSYLKKK